MSSFASRSVDSLNSSERGVNSSSNDISSSQSTPSSTFDKAVGLLEDDCDYGAALKLFDDISAQVR